MRRFHFVGVAGLLVLVAAVMFAATAGQARASQGCGKKLVFLVWPKGHPAIPRFTEFPEVLNPHIEVYRGFSSNYDAANAAAYAIGGKPPHGIARGGFFTACANYGNPISKGTVAAPKTTITKETALKCTLPRSPVADVVFRKSGIVDLYLHTGALVLAQAHVTKTSAALTVISKHCTLTAAPKP
jgi:hypothetical protein